jgi:hypothetical protein
MASGSQSMSNTLIIHDPSKWELVFLGHKVTHASLTIVDPSVWLTHLFNRCQQAEQDGQTLATAINKANAIIVNLNDLQFHYDFFMDGVIQLFQSLSLSIGNLSGFSESHFREPVTSCQIFGSEIWTTISRLPSTIKGRDDAFDSRQEPLNEDIQLLRIGSDYWKHSNHIPNDLHSLQLPIGEQTRAPNTNPEESQQLPRSLLNDPEI